MHLLLITLLYSLPLSNGVSDPIFREDYTYDRGSRAFYKEHTKKVTWSEAVKKCAQEGRAYLAAPTTEADVRALLNHMGALTNTLWLGIHDLFSEGYFNTLNGFSDTEIYINWEDSEPNNNNGNENCVQMGRDGKCNDKDCNSHDSFICKKDLSSLDDLGHKGGYMGSATPFFRTDYTYESAFKAFYKAHRIKRKWSDAVFMCAAEGAELVAPTTEDEMQLMRNYIRSQTLKSNTIWLGIHDTLIEGRFITLNGTSASRMYMNWRKGEPNNENGKEDCVLMLQQGVYIDGNCDTLQKFVCKKDLASLVTTNAICETYDTDYFYSLDADRCYKVHLTPRNWFDAYKTCRAEEAHLGIINSEDEAKIFMKAVQGKLAVLMHKEKIKEIHLGFNDILSPGTFKSIKGETLYETGYYNWSSGQPKSESNERCGSMRLSDGKLNHIGCHVTGLFICEKSIGRAISLDNSLRFGEAELRLCV